MKPPIYFHLKESWKQGLYQTFEDYYLTPSDALYFYTFFLALETLEEAFQICTLFKDLGKLQGKSLGYFHPSYIMEL